MSEEGLRKAGSLSAELAVERKLKEQEKKFVLERHYSQGLAYYSEQKFDDALRAFNLVLKIDRSYKSCLKYIEKIQSDIKELAARKARESNSRLYDQVLDLTKQGSYDRALEKLELIISNKNPEYKGRAEEYIEVIEQKMSAEKQGQEWSAEDQSRRAKEREITDRLTRGRKYYKKRQFDKAITEWQRILALTDTMSIDYKVAEKLIVKARKKKIRIGEKELAREKEITTQLLLTDSRKKWLAVSAGNAGESEVEASRAGEEVVQSKKQILVLSGQRIAVDFDNKHIRDVLKHLTALSNINIILEDALFPKSEEGLEVSGAISPYVTIHLKDIPMIEALDLMLRTKDLKYRVEENLIWITTVETLEKENFKTRVFNLSSGAGAIKDIIEEVVSFPEGSSINLDARSDTLIVTHTPTKLEVIRDIVTALDRAPVQVEIQARFLEVQDEFAEEFASGIAAANVYMRTNDYNAETGETSGRLDYIEMDSYAVTDQTL
ncbi:MAG: hypothetical protein KAV18_03730, partial [Candidatus Omnitrophica bacterium]|nr:hypothetical protein [Candidatus Omnitrophota bacterium]